MSPSALSGDSSAMQFEILHAASKLGPRLGRLATKSRRVIETPHFVATTSRGAVPHLSQDSMCKHTALKGVYVPLEDFIERASLKQIPPVLSQDAPADQSPLRNFIALPADQLLILGARRTPPVTSPWSNTNAGLSISTAFGFGHLDSADYAEAAATLKPDIVVGLADIHFGEKAGLRRIERMGLRTERWFKELLHPTTDAEEDMEERGLIGSIFAPILPIPREQQSQYLDLLADEWRDKICGLAIYDADVLPELPGTLMSLPTLSFSEPSSPAKVLREISLGLDVFTLPYLARATDAGVALDFRFPAPEDAEAAGVQLALGSDMWAPDHSTDLSPLVSGCDCYACLVHHRAYIHHLLSAKEMLAWVLLQIHNLRIVDEFFAGIRTSIARGTFDEDRDRFLRIYEAEIPQNTELGPRVRGYQFKSEGPGELKKNRKAYNTLDDARDRAAEAELPEPETSSEQLEQQGFGQKESREVGR